MVDLDSPPRLVLTPAQLAQMLTHLRQSLPEEACGLAAGKGSRVDLLVPVENRLHSPVKYTMAPLEQFKAFQRFEAQGLDLLAIFHSHPAGPPLPSPTDLAEFAYPGTLSVIASPLINTGAETPIVFSGLVWQRWWVRAFDLEPPGYHEVKLGLST